MLIKSGDIVRVDEVPWMWASYFCSNNPLDLSYPITIQIIEIKEVEDHIPIRALCLEDDTEYGFDYDELIKKPYSILNNKSKGFISSQLIKKIIQDG